VVESAQKWHRNYAACALDGTRDRRILLQ